MTSRMWVLIAVAFGALFVAMGGGWEVRPREQLNRANERRVAQVKAAAGVAAEAEAEEGAQPRGRIASPCRGRSVTVRVPRSRYPHIVDHIEDTWRAGHPRVVRLNRRGAEERRERLTDWYEDRWPQPAGDGLDLDERPMAILRPTWRGHIRPINARENRSEGSSVGGQLRGVPDGTCVRYDFGG